MVHRPENGGALEVRPSIPFVGQLDGVAIARSLPPEHRLRGLFFTRCREDLSTEDFASILPDLREPPRLGPYLAFSEYPTHDYTLLFARAAVRVHPRVDAREAWRRYAREEILAFSRTMLGQVTLSLMSDPTAALLRFPKVVKAVTAGTTATAEQLSERAVRVQLGEAIGTIEHAIGMFEGIVMFFKRHPRIDVEMHDNKWTFVVSWTM